MAIIHHYVNLVCWRDIAFLTLNDENEHVLHCDSFSMNLLMKLFGRHVGIRSGVDFWTSLSDADIQSYQILSSDMSREEAVMLPMFENAHDVAVFGQTFSSSATKIIIGISSPKQNHLAVGLGRNNSDLREIHCIGAALNVNTSLIQRPYWYYFLLAQPKRTLAKLIQTMQNALRILVKTSDRNAFMKFCDRVN